MSDQARVLINVPGHNGSDGYQIEAVAKFDFDEASEIITVLDIVDAYGRSYNQSQLPVAEWTNIADQIWETIHDRD